LKHCEFSDKENIFAAYYNIGISSRFLKKYKEGIEAFKKALEWAVTRRVNPRILYLGC
jgi:tetratricopeptide (TPR) repeat protein